MMNGFSGMRVLSLESRRAEEMRKLISNFGGVPTVAPSMREVPIESNTAALAFASALLHGEIHVVIFLTGVGTRALTKVIEAKYPLPDYISALSKIPVIARGPKPVAALREMGVPIAFVAPEPNTWREVVGIFDNNRDTLPLGQRQIAIQEYGESNAELTVALQERGAKVLLVPVYEWTLPADIAPLRDAIQALVRGEIDVAMFTSSAQLRHLFLIAARMNLETKLKQSLAKVVIVSIGPITSEELRAHGLSPQMEPSHPKMGIMVKEAADSARELKRSLLSRAGSLQE
jgi:uroporphyrinogen-III synthase